jgi:5-methylcytosine-specific restriction endonuclease McrA
MAEHPAVIGCVIFSMAEKRTYKERRQYLLKAVQRRRERVRLMAVNYKGGRCQVCGYDRCVEALEFHHLDPAQKDFGISYKGYTRSWEKVKQEVDKCVLLCANCHREAHAGILQLPQVTVVEKLGEFREAYPGIEPAR